MATSITSGSDVPITSALDCNGSVSTPSPAPSDAVSNSPAILYLSIASCGLLLMTCVKVYWKDLGRLVVWDRPKDNARRTKLGRTSGSLASTATRCTVCGVQPDIRIGYKRPEFRRETRGSMIFNGPQPLSERGSILPDPVFTMQQNCSASHQHGNEGGTDQGVYIIPLEHCREASVSEPSEQGVQKSMIRSTCTSEDCLGRDSTLPERRRTSIANSIGALQLSLRDDALFPEGSGTSLPRATGPNYHLPDGQTPGSRMSEVAFSTSPSGSHFGISETMDPLDHSSYIPLLAHRKQQPVCADLPIYEGGAHGCPCEQNDEDFDINAAATSPGPLLHVTNSRHRLDSSVTMLSERFILGNTDERRDSATSRRRDSAASKRRDSVASKRQQSAASKRKGSAASKRKESPVSKRRRLSEQRQCTAISLLDEPLVLMVPPPDSPPCVPSNGMSSHDSGLQSSKPLESMWSPGNAEYKPTKKQKPSFTRNWSSIISQAFRRKTTCSYADEAIAPTSSLPTAPKRHSLIASKIQSGIVGGFVSSDRPQVLPPDRPPLDIPTSHDASLEPELPALKNARTFKKRAKLASQSNTVTSYQKYVADQEAAGEPAKDFVEYRAEFVAKQAVESSTARHTVNFFKMRQASRKWQSAVRASLRSKAGARVQSGGGIVSTLPRRKGSRHRKLHNNVSPYGSSSPAPSHQARPMAPHQDSQYGQDSSPPVHRRTKSDRHVKRLSCGIGAVDLQDIPEDGNVVTASRRLPKGSTRVARSLGTVEENQDGFMNHGFFVDDGLSGRSLPVQTPPASSDEHMRQSLCYSIKGDLTDNCNYVPWCVRRGSSTPTSPIFSFESADGLAATGEHMLHDDPVTCNSVVLRRSVSPTELSPHRHHPGPKRTSCSLDAPGLSPAISNDSLIDRVMREQTGISSSFLTGTPVRSPASHSPCFSV